MTTPSLTVGRALRPTGPSRRPRRASLAFRLKAAARALTGRRPAPIRIFLIRHGESEANVDKTLYRNKADHSVSLSPLGHRQAAEAGRVLARFLIAHPPRGRTRIWVSPYRRTRQTAEDLRAGAAEIGGPLTEADTRESFLLSEQQFGLFDGIPDEELPHEFPREHAHYQKLLDHEGEFWAPMPLGESRMHHVMRVMLLFGSIHRDLDNGITDIVVVCHSATARAFAMGWLHQSPEWFDAEPKPGNASIRLIDGNRDRGYIHGEARRKSRVPGG